MPRADDHPRQNVFLPGLAIEVRSGFDNGWKRGFEVAGIEDELCRIRRCSDGAELPVALPVRRIRPA